MTSPSILNFNKDTLRIIPFGGCGEFGMNLTAYIVEDRIYVVDAGVSFPDSSKLGIEAVYPDMDEWFTQFGGVYAYVITHGHEDHIGALPYLLEKWPGPVYATPWTAALIQNKLSRRGVPLKYPIIEVKAGDIVDAEDFSIEYVHFNHSIPDACGLYIKMSKLKVFHTGDFKIDRTPVIEAQSNLKRLAEIGNEGLDLLLADSTNAHIDGPSPSEAIVVEPMIKAIKSSKGATLVTTFSSNFWRLKTIFDACKTASKKVFVLGSGLESSMQIATELGLYSPPPGLLIDATTANNMNRKDLVVVLTGSQGEHRSALMRIAKGENKQFSVAPGDLCIFSSRTIPGNEKVIQTMMSLLERRGAEIFSARHDKDIHVSGHAYRDDLKTIISALKPKTFIPVHGTFSHMQSNSKIPGELGLKKTRSVVVENGDVIDLAPSGVTLSERVGVVHKFVDSESYISLPYDIMRERLRIGELGLVVVTITYDKKTRDILDKVRITMQGLGEREGETLREIEDGCAKAAEKGFERGFGSGGTQAEELAEHIRVEVRRKLFSIYRKKPVVIAHLHPV